jgi:hypothetical protein
MGSPRKISAHCASCPQWLELFAADPSRALSPTEEHRRWEDEGRDAERLARLEQTVSDTQARRAAGAARFAAPRNILED